MNSPEKHEALIARSPNESARVTGFGRTTIFKAIKNGELRARKHGRRTLILDADLREWLSGLPQVKAAA